MKAKDLCNSNLQMAAWVPKDPLTLGTKEDFWESVARADEDVAARRTHFLTDVAERLRSKYGL